MQTIVAPNVPKAVVDLLMTGNEHRSKEAVWVAENCLGLASKCKEMTPAVMKAAIKEAHRQGGLTGPEGWVAAPVSDDGMNCLYAILRRFVADIDAGEYPQLVAAHYGEPLAQEGWVSPENAATGVTPELAKMRHEIATMLESPLITKEDHKKLPKDTVALHAHLLNLLKEKASIMNANAHPNAPHQVTTVAPDPNLGVQAPEIPWATYRAHIHALLTPTAVHPDQLAAAQAALQQDPLLLAEARGEIPCRHEAARVIEPWLKQAHQQIAAGQDPTLSIKTAVNYLWARPIFQDAPFPQVGTPEFHQAAIAPIEQANAYHASQQQQQPAAQPAPAPIAAVPPDAPLTPDMTLHAQPLANGQHAVFATQLAQPPVQITYDPAAVLQAVAQVAQPSPEAAAAMQAAGIQTAAPAGAQVTGNAVDPEGKGPAKLTFKAKKAAVDVLKAKMAAGATGYEALVMDPDFIKVAESYRDTPANFYDRLIKAKVTADFSIQLPEATACPAADNAAVNPTSSSTPSTSATSSSAPQPAAPTSSTMESAYQGAFVAPQQPAQPSPANFSGNGTTTAFTTTPPSPAVAPAVAATPSTSTGSSGPSVSETPTPPAAGVSTSQPTSSPSYTPTSSLSDLLHERSLVLAKLRSIDNDIIRAQADMITEEQALRDRLAAIETAKANMPAYGNYTSYVDLGVSQVPVGAGA